MIARGEVAANVPAEAIDLARRLLGACLLTLGAEDRISQISDMRIAPYRHLVQLLPLRVYVYTLGSPIADMDYESILEGDRPIGAVFDAFQLAFGDMRCGFYVYSLEALADTATLRSLWRAVREEVGLPVETAALPAHHLRHHGGGIHESGSSEALGGGQPTLSLIADLPDGMMIPLDGDPEAIVRMLVGQAPPSQQLSTYRLTSSEDIMRPIVAFTITANEFPFEREDLIDFVRRNENLIKGGINFLDTLKNNLQGFDQAEKILRFVDVFSKQSRLILSGREAEVDVRSEIIYWLVIILASQVNNGILSLEAAISYLKRQEYRVRLGPATLRPMLLEFARKLGTPEKQEPAMLHLILVAAELCRDTAVAIAGRELTGELDGDPTIASGLERICHWATETDLDDYGQKFVREIRARTYTKVDDADI